MQAVILAAGMGKRLKELTRNNTKCMVRVNGVALIDRMLRQIEKCGVSRIIIVAGYKSQELVEYIESLGITTPIIYIYNTVYDKTNNIYSLSLTKEWLCREDTLLLESDLIFEDAVLKVLMDDPRDTLALVDKYEAWMDGTCLKLSEDDTIEAFITKQNFRFNDSQDYYKTVNIYKFSRVFSQNYYVPFLEAYQSALGLTDCYEQVLRVISLLDKPVIKAKRLDGQRWYEIDDIQDLDIAESIFTPDEDEKVRLLQGRYGGYWRYPKLLDFCYLVNPFFPPENMKNEIRANFDTLLTEYPSGMRVNSLLAAKNFGVSEKNIVVGNGAAELIKSLMENLDGTVGFVRPTFDEYPNRYDRKKSIDYIPSGNDYLYSADELMSYFDDKDIQSLIVVNPENPTGNYIPKQDLLRVIRWADKKSINLVVDESFVDFADEEDSSIIHQGILDAHPHLYVMKSISKSYGVPGLRLGVLASGDTEMIAFMKKDVGIWNINSFAEFFMQIEEKYDSDYRDALIRIRKERKRFEKELSYIEGIRVIPSQANYIMVELEGSISPKVLLKKLLIKYNLLIKELTTKTNGKNYLRLAIRTEEDNNRLLKALSEELKETMMAKGVPDAE